MGPPLLYHYDTDGCFTGVITPAQRSPADIEEVWLVPDRSTLEAPPNVGDGHVAVRRDNAWVVMTDLRGRLAWHKTQVTGRLIMEPGDLSSEETLLAPPDPRHVWSEAEQRWRLSLSHAKADKRRLVDFELERRNAAGFIHDGHVYQVDDISHARITAVGLLAGFDAANWPADFHFIAANNTPVSHSASSFLTLAKAAARKIIARRINARRLKDLIGQAVNDAALAAIDISQGWD